jgi:hypothetical protein
LFQHDPKLGARVADQQWAIPVETNSGGGVSEADVEEDDPVGSEPGPCVVVDDRPSTDGQHPVVILERTLHRRTFQISEGGFALINEEVTDGYAGSSFDVGVSVAERHASALSEQLTDCRLAGARRPDEHHQWRHCTTIVAR